MENIKNVILLLCWQGMAMPAANAFEWVASDVQLLYGNDFELGDDERTTATVEHSHGWQYGTNFFLLMSLTAMILALRSMPKFILT